MITLDKNPEQIELIKALGSRNKTVSAEAREVFAAILGPIVQEVLQQVGNSGLLFTDSPFDADDSPSYPLDLYYNQNDAGYVSIWSQTMAGGLPRSEDVSTISELKFDCYNLDTAISMRKKYARRARLDVMSKFIERMIQEVLIKQETNAWAVLLKAAAEAQTDITRVLGKSVGNAANTTTGSSLRHVIRSTNASTFLLEDMNALMTRLRRINSSWTGGTPAARYSQGLTDLFVSPEVKQDIRAFAYEPLNTATNARGSAAGDHAGIPLPDSIREGIFNAPGMESIYGVNIIELNEFGKGHKYNKFFDTFAASTSYTQVDGTNGTTFTEASDEILIGVDNRRNAFIRPVAVQDENGGQFVVYPDDQYTDREDVAGFYGSLEEGRVILDSRAVAGILLG